MVRDAKPKKADAPEVQYVEREVTLSLLNEKLNYIIGKLDNASNDEEDEE